MAPGALVSLNYERDGSGPSPYYGYYIAEFPSMNDNGVIVGRTNKANSANPLITSNAGQAAKWANGAKTNFNLVGCKDTNADGIADNTFCGSRALNINNAGIATGSSNDYVAAQDTYFEKSYTWNANGSVQGRIFFNYPSQSQTEDVNEKGQYVGCNYSVNP